MPNYCDYEMRIKGSKKAIERVLACLNANYNYGEGKPAHKHFFRVFEAEKPYEIENNRDGTYTQQVYGYCAWSVYSCMCSGDHTYYKDLKESYPDIFMGTNLLEQSQDCEIEVFSEEPGMGFSEHYIFKNGKCICDDTQDIESGGYDEKGNPTNDIDWETYDGDTIIFNPHRIRTIDGFNWAF